MSLGFGNRSNMGQLGLAWPPTSCPTQGQQDSQSQNKLEWPAPRPCWSLCPWAPAPMLPTVPHTLPDHQRPQSHLDCGLSLPTRPALCPEDPRTGSLGGGQRRALCSMQQPQSLPPQNQSPSGAQGGQPLCQTRAPPGLAGQASGLAMLQATQAHPVMERTSCPVLW